MPFWHDFTTSNFYQMHNLGLTKIYKKQIEYNKAFVEAGLAGRVPLIKSSELSRQIRGVKVPLKKEIIRQYQAR